MVVDASALIDVLVPPEPSVRDFLCEYLPGAALPWIAPDVLTFEVLAVARRRALRGEWPEPAATAAVREALEFPLELVPMRPLAAGAWMRRHSVTAADALYLELAVATAEPFLTTDRRLARAAGAAGVDVICPP
ncbi:MAG: type II toxin-antitoxin system VapC family toxin [Thermoleophilaceae bacterium]